jgi:hypothetical protein
MTELSAPSKEKTQRAVRGERTVPAEDSAPRGSGRRKHDAKITVYVSGDELLAMEHARLALRGEHGLVVDRGRLVREAMAILLADFSEHGGDSVIVGRLREGGFESGQGKAEPGEAED